MLYHSPLKHFVKGLLGRKNDAWYFDRMIAAYAKNNGQNIGDFIDDLIKSSCKNDTKNPLFSASFDIRNALKIENKNALSSQKKKFILQQPPADFSPAFNSWFYNIGSALEHIGHEVIYQWENISDALKNADYFFTCFNAEYLQQIDWSVINATTKVICYCNPFLETEESVDQHIQIFRSHRIDAAFTFCNESFASNSMTGKQLETLDIPIISIPFSVNPIYHFPSPTISEALSFVFLGSANWDKAGRYGEFFLPIVKEFKGVIYGQGWPWTKHHDLDFNRDRLLYGSASIGLNLHIDIQLRNANELNERTYILAGIGQPQLCDNPPELKQVFEDKIFYANNANEYNAKFKWLLENPAIRLQQTNELMKYTLNVHNSFTRATILSKTLNDLLN